MVTRSGFDYMSKVTDLTCQPSLYRKQATYFILWIAK